MSRPTRNPLPRHHRTRLAGLVFAGVALMLLCLPEPAAALAAQAGSVSLWARLRPVLGLGVLLLIGWAVGYRKGRFPWRVVLWGVGLQLVLAVLILRSPAGAAFFDAVNQGLRAVLHFAEDGARFIFGDLVFNNVPVGVGEAGSNAPVDTSGGMVARTGGYFAFHVLPTIIFVSSLMTVLYHLGVMQRIVQGFAWVMRRTMGTSGAETLATAGNVFIGQMEAPLLVKPFVSGMTRSELMALMTGGFATVSGSTLAAYVGMLSGRFPDIGGHLIAASVMSAPAALVMAKLMLPEQEVAETAEGPGIHVERTDVNVIDAAARGASEGLYLALNIGAMIVAFLGLLALVNALLGWAGGLAGAENLTLERLFGWVLAPIAWLVGVDWADAGTVGQLLGVKTALNEFVAFLQLADLLEAGAPLSARSTVIASYALAGFANFGSVAMQIAGIGEIAPSRRHDLARLGIRAMIGGTLAALMTAAVAALLI